MIIDAEHHRQTPMDECNRNLLKSCKEGMFETNFEAQTNGNHDIAVQCQCNFLQ